jgi:hypothetical protein
MVMDPYGTLHRTFSRVRLQSYWSLGSPVRFNPIIGGMVKGDIVAREPVELGPASKIYGNIWTRSLVIKDGAIFEGICRMIEEQKAS